MAHSEQSACVCVSLLINASLFFHVIVGLIQVIKYRRSYLTTGELHSAINYASLESFSAPSRP